MLSTPSLLTIADIQAAAQRIHRRVAVSPCVVSDRLSRLVGRSIACKLDLFQATGSFKERGACNRLLQLSPTAQQRGVIAASAGNHAQALAYHGRALGIAVTVVMPTTAPLVKVGNCRALGARVVLHGDRFSEAMQHAQALAQSQGLELIHAYDDAAIIAGQGTIGLEMLDEIPDLSSVIVPLGGGGLAAGIACAVKTRRPEVTVIGVEPASVAKIGPALAAGHPVAARSGITLADGLAVPQVGVACLPLLQRYLDAVIEVDEDAIATAILRLVELEKIVAEGAGAVPLAALLSAHPALERARAGTTCLVLCGGNIDPGVLGRIIERGLARDGRLCRIAIEVRDRPGQLAAALSAVALAGANVKEIHHDRAFTTHDPAAVAITLVLETRDHAHQDEVRVALRAAGVAVE